MEAQTLEKQNETFSSSESVGEAASPTSSLKSSIMFDTRELFAKAFGPQKKDKPSFIRDLCISFLQKLFHEKMFNTFAKKYQHIRGLEYIDNFLDFLGITYTVTSSELKNIPSTGRLIIIANHITGLQDSFSLMQLIANKRENKNVKLLMNEMMVGATGNFSWGIPVNVHGAITKSSLKQIYKCLDNDEAIIIFPAGVVNRLSAKGLKDIPWKASFLKIAKKKNTPILPIKIKGRNSRPFYLLSLLLPNSISSFMLFHEFASARKRKPLHFSIGKVIPSASFANKEIANQEYVDMFYKHLYSLETNKGDILKTEITIGKPKNKIILRAEVEKAEFLGNTKDGKKIIIVDAVQSPFLIRELGRTREISFRAIGGGSGKAHDNDGYDHYYQHLVLWDPEELEVVGSYRIAETKKIIAELGEKGLYTHKYCHLHKDFSQYHNNSMELGRSFIQPKYWGTRALDNLWQGLGAYLAHHPEVNYVYGLVSMSADNPPKATAALVYFYSTFFHCSTKIMEARNPYILSQEDLLEFDALFFDLTYRDAFVVLKSYLKNLDTAVPTLFKQYVELYKDGAVCFLDFIIADDDFSGVVAGCIIADVSCMKPNKRKRYIESFQQLKTEDVVTGLPNRTHFDRLFQAITRYQRKSDTDFMLAIVKVEPLSYNVDQNGEPVWDQYIASVAKKITTVLRDRDVVARWADDEFMILLRNLSANDAKTVFKKLNAGIKKICPDNSLTRVSHVGGALYQRDETLEETTARVYASFE